MKKIIFLLIICLSLTSCEDLFRNDDELYYPFPERPVTFFEINMGSSVNSISETSLGKFSEDESAIFQLQAQHYRISELDRNPDTGEIIYKYQPQEGFVGEDYVEILAPTDSNGNRIFESKVLEFLIKVSH